MVIAIEVKREYYQNCFIYWQHAIPLQWAQLTKQFTQPGWAEMTYIVSSGALNSTHSLTRESFYVLKLHDCFVCVYMFCFTLEFAS